MKKYAELTTVSLNSWKNGDYQYREDIVAEEVPVALVYNGISHVVMLATPAALEDFALGFSVTEGIIENSSEIFACDIVQAEAGVRIELQIASEQFQLLKERRRNLAGRTGCGLCGTDSLAQAVRILAPIQCDPVFKADVLHSGFHQMEQLQRLKQCTGATHAAAWLAHDGNIELIREDVGRHNALDKLIGVLFKEKIDRSSGAVLVTSRASYEMVQKCVSAEIGMLAAVSAPTGLAIRIANQTNLTLVGFVRENSHAVYTHPQRLL